MRGKDGKILLSFDGSRITPAHAGKSFRVSKICFSIEDHPRTCGEKTKKIP